ncbi:MAG: GNAT family N-acetyltransferase [Pyrinomonadaceae bacterium]
MQTETRRYTAKDLDSVVAIFRSNIPKYFGPSEEPGLLEFLAAMRAEDYYVIEIDGEIVGAGGIALNEDDTVSLCWGMVREDHLGTGLGKKLTEFRIKAAREKFGDRAMVTSTSQHTEGFYNKFGFRTVEHTPNGFGPGIDICKMRLDVLSTI